MCYIFRNEQEKTKPFYYIFSKIKKTKREKTKNNSTTPFNITINSLSMNRYKYRNNN